MIYNIRGYHGGLGDQLQHSTIPMRLAEQGHDVKLYTGPEVQPFRNPEIEKFVWGYNPHVKGSSIENWTAGDIVGSVYQNRHDDFIRNIEAMHGLMPENSLPIIYYEPHTFKSIDGVIELSGITSGKKFNRDTIIAKTQEIIKESGANFAQIVSKHQHNSIDIPNVKKIWVSSLEEVSDIIHNCAILVTLDSGIHSLAAAIQRFSQRKHYSFIVGKDWDYIMREKRFIYPNIKYIKDSND